MLPGLGHPSASAITWAEGTVLALGTNEQVRGVSRGDSHLVDLRGAFVVPVGPDEAVCWPPESTLAIGSPADLAVLSGDPRVDGEAGLLPLAVVRGGHVVRGRWPSTS